MPLAGCTPATLALPYRADLARARPPRLRFPCGMTISGTLAVLRASVSVRTQHRYTVRDATTPPSVLAPPAFQPDRLQPCFAPLHLSFFASLSHAVDVKGAVGATSCYHYAHSRQTLTRLPSVRYIHTACCPHLLPL